MRVIKFIMGIMMSVVCMSGAFAQSSATNTTKATAQLVSSCKIQGQNVNFGNLILPITTQQASSNLTVLCTRSSAFTISMTQQNNIWIIVPNGNASLSYAWNTDTSTRVSLSSTSCGAMGAGACITAQNYSDAGSAGSLGLSSAVCSYPPGCEVYKNGSSNSGTMKGASKGDSVAYSIQNPSDSSKVWNSVNTYAGTGTGVNQSIPVIATLIPSGGSSYPTPDMYTDTVTTQISF